MKISHFFILTIFVFISVGYSEDSNRGEWIRTEGLRIGSLDSDPRGFSILKENAPTEYWDEIRSLQTLPPQLFKKYGDSIFVFSSCKQGSCTEKLIFVYDANREVGFYLEATASEDESSATYFSSTCSRKQLEDIYWNYSQDWLSSEHIKVSENIFFMRPTSSDSIIESRYRIALQLFKAGKVLGAGDTLSLIRRIPAKEFSQYHVAIMNDLGFFYEQSNRPIQAIPILEEVVAWDDRRTPAYLNLADAYAKAGDKEKARANYGKYVEQMEAAHKGAKVPSRVRDFLKN
jgi:tetratricopeptide (TPR) repeat protein